MKVFTCILCGQAEKRNNDLISLLESKFQNRTEIVRDGSVVIEAISISERWIKGAFLRFPASSWRGLCRRVRTG